MMKLIRAIAFVFVIFSFNSCSLFQIGYYNSHGQYIPKNPNYKLKNKAGLIYPNGLDTLSVYQLVEISDDGKIVYPLSELTTEQEHSSVKELNTAQYYIKFYSKGRCAYFTIPKEDQQGQIRKIRQKDITLNNPTVQKNYYYSDGMGLQLESFTLGDGSGAYVIIDCQLSEDGSRLSSSEGKFTRIYEMVDLPQGIEFQAFDW